METNHQTTGAALQPRSVTGSAAKPKQQEQRQTVQQTNPKPTGSDRQATGRLAFLANPQNGDWFQIGKQVYRFRPAGSANSKGEIVIGVDAAASAFNARKAINHDGSSANYYEGTPKNKDVTATSGGTAMNVRTYAAGTGANKIAVSSFPETRLKWGAKTLIGGVGGPQDPVEAPDNLASNSYARALDGLGEGEIAGLVDKNGEIITDPAQMGRAIFLDETPLLSSDGKPNFQGVKVGMNWGTEDQQAITGFGPAAETIYSGVQIRKANPVTVGITNSEADRIEVAVRFPSLLTQDAKTGNINGSEVRYKVLVSLNGGDYVALQEVVVKGKTRSSYLRTTSHKLPKSNTPDADSWNIRVQRLTDDAADLKVANDTFLDFVTLYTSHRFRYPHTAYVAMEINARGFDGIPSRQYRVRGLLIRVPSNYFPETREYNRDHLTGEPVLASGVPVEQPWNGTFWTAWSDNPAWCFFDLMTNTRYGLGEQMQVTDQNPDGTVDKWTLYSIARFCDESVSDGFGNQEPRFTCNLAITTREEAWRVMQDMASVFRGILYWQSGAITAVQDRARTPIQTFAPANVIDGVFSYSGTARKARHTVCIVRWNDPADFYRPRFEYVEDIDGINRYGINQTEVAAFGCTSRGQAHRLGKWTLLTELYETETVAFRAGIEASYLRPGDVIAIADNNRAGAQIGGRIVGIAADRLSVTLDRAIVLPAGVNKIRIQSPQGFLQAHEVADSTDIAAMRTNQTVERTITTAAGTVTSVAFGVALPAAVEVPFIWCLDTATLDPQLFRVLGVDELESGQYGVSALQYVAEKYDETLSFEEPDITELPDQFGEIQDIQSLTLELAPTVTPEGVTLKILASWEAPESATMIQSYAVEVRMDSGDWRTVTETGGLSAEIIYQVPGTYDVRVTAISTVGARSDGVMERIVVGSETPIDTTKIVGLELVDGANATEFQGRDAKFVWRLSSPASAPQGFTDPLFDVFEVIVLNGNQEQIYREETRNAAFVFTYEKNRETSGGPYAGFTVRVRALDRYRNPSPAAEITVLNPAPQAPTQQSGIVAWRTAYLNWRNPDAADLAGVEVWRGNDAVFANAVLLATVSVVPGESSAFTETGIEVGTAVWYWLRSLDTFGSLSPTTLPITGISGQIAAQDLADFAVDATKMFISAVVLTGDRWGDNSPGAGRIAWNPHTLVFRGVKYEIAAGNTPAAHEFVYWRGPIYDAAGVQTTPGETVYRTSIAHPKNTPGVMLENDFLIATNAAAQGVHDLAWRGIANAVVGSAMIMRAAIQDAHIDNVTASKIMAGTIDAQVVKIGGVTGALQSTDFATGVAGWRIRGDGSAELNNVVIRGTLDAAKIYNNSIVANSAFPSNALKPVAFDQTSNADWNYEWGVSGFNGVTRILYGGAWDGTGYVGGTASDKALRLGPMVAFCGVGVADGFVNGTSRSSRNRLGTSLQTQFLVLFGGNRSGTTTGMISILYRVFPANIPEPLNNSTLYPWVQRAAVAGNANLFFTQMITLSIPPDHIVQFAPAPIAETGNSTSTTDHITSLNMQVLAFNP